MDLAKPRYSKYLRACARRYKEWIDEQPEPATESSKNMNTLTNHPGLLEIDEDDPSSLMSDRDDLGYFTTDFQSEIETTDACSCSDVGSCSVVADYNPEMYISPQHIDLGALVELENPSLGQIPTPTEQELKKQFTAEPKPTHYSPEQMRPEMVHPSPPFRFETPPMSTAPTRDEREPSWKTFADALKHTPQKRPITPPIAHSDDGSTGLENASPWVAGTISEQGPEETTNAASSTFSAHLGIPPTYTKPVLPLNWMRDENSRTISPLDLHKQSAAAPTRGGLPFPESTHSKFPPTNLYGRHIEERNEYYSHYDSITPPPRPPRAQSSKSRAKGKGKGKERAVDLDSNSSQYLDCQDDAEFPRYTEKWVYSTENNSFCAGPGAGVLNSGPSDNYAGLTMPERFTAEAKIHGDYVARLTNLQGANAHGQTANALQERFEAETKYYMARLKNFQDSDPYRQTANPIAERFMAEDRVHNDYVARLSEIQDSNARGQYANWQEKYEAEDETTKDYLARLRNIQNSNSCGQTANPIGERFMAEAKLHNDYVTDYMIRMADIQDSNARGQYASLQEKYEEEAKAHDEYVARLKNFQAIYAHGQHTDMHERFWAQNKVYDDFFACTDKIKDLHAQGQDANLQEKYEAEAAAKNHVAHLNYLQYLTQYGQTPNSIAESAVSIAQTAAQAAAIARATEFATTNSLVGEPYYEQGSDSASLVYEHIEYYDDQRTSHLGHLEDMACFRSTAPELEQEEDTGATSASHAKRELPSESTKAPQPLRSLKTAVRDLTDGMVLDSPPTPEPIRESLSEESGPFPIGEKAASTYGEGVGPQDDEYAECPALVDTSNPSAPQESINTFTNVDTRGVDGSLTPPGSPTIPKEDVDCDQSSLNVTSTEKSLEPVNKPRLGPMPMALRAYQSMQDITTLMMKGTISTAKRTFSAEQPDRKASGKRRAASRQSSPDPGPTAATGEGVMYDVDLGSHSPDRGPEEDDWVNVSSQRELEDARACENFARVAIRDMLREDVVRLESTFQSRQSAGSTDTTVVDEEETKRSKEEYNNQTPASEGIQNRQSEEPLDSWVGI